MVVVLFHFWMNYSATAMCLYEIERALDENNKIKWYVEVVLMNKMCDLALDRGGTISQSGCVCGRWRCQILTNTGRQFLWRPRSIRLAEALQFANQLVSFAAVVSNATAKRVAFAGMPSMTRIRRLTTRSSCSNIDLFKMV